MNYVQSSQVAEDVVQDFFVSLWFKSKDLEINTSLKSYLFTSVKNRCLDYLKHTKIKENFQKQAAALSSPPEASQFNLYVETELNEILTSAIEKLPSRCREIFKLSRYKGLKNAEIARELNISKRTVELQVSNALKFLRGKLKNLLPLYLIAFILP